MSGTTARNRVASENNSFEHSSARSRAEPNYRAISLSHISRGVRRASRGFLGNTVFSATQYQQNPAQGQDDTDSVAPSDRLAEGEQGQSDAQDQHEKQKKARAACHRRVERVSTTLLW